MKNTINLIVTDKEKGQRIDSFITYKQISLSRTRVKRLILNKKLKLNNSILISGIKGIGKLFLITKSLNLGEIQCLLIKFQEET